MSKEPKDPKTIGYLPDETPPFWKLILYALQQIIVMFPATILVALLTGFHLATTIFASGFATIGFILVTKRKIPLYYGSSFSYLSAIRYGRKPVCAAYRCAANICTKRYGRKNSSII